MWNYLIAFIMLSCVLSAQTFRYKIKLQNVTNLPEAKYATDPMRSLFETYPTFNDSLAIFDFSSSVFIEESYLINYMQDKNYDVTFFSYEALKPKEREEIK
ncbi:MAG: hypothetical protein ABIP51_14275 [Bacteroidia bacterium]